MVAAIRYDRSKAKDDYAAGLRARERPRTVIPLLIKRFAASSSFGEISLRGMRKNAPKERVFAGSCLNLTDLSTNASHLESYFCWNNFTTSRCPFNDDRTNENVFIVSSSIFVSSSGRNHEIQCASRARLILESQSIPECRAIGYRLK